MPSCSPPRRAAWYAPRVRERAGAGAAVPRQTRCVPAREPTRARARGRRRRSAVSTVAVTFAGARERERRDAGACPSCASLSAFGRTRERRERVVERERAVGRRRLRLVVGRRRPRSATFPLPRRRVAVPVQVKRYVPGVRGPASIGIVAPSGPDERSPAPCSGGRPCTTGSATSATPSPFGESTGSAERRHVDARVARRAAPRRRRARRRGRTACSAAVPSNAIVVEPPASSADAVTAPSCIIASASSKFVIADAVAGLASVDGDEQDLPVRALPDRGARVVRGELRRRERLVRRGRRPCRPRRSSGRRRSRSTMPSHAGLSV